MGTLADLELSPDDIEGACEELALTMGPEIGAADVLNAARELAGGARDPVALAGAMVQLMELAGGYADDGLLTEGHRRLPCDSPEAVSRSWRELCREAHRYSAADLAAVKSALMEAAAGFGFALNDPDGPGPSPDGTALSGGELDPWGNTPESYRQWNAGPGPSGMAAPQPRTAREMARAYSPAWYEAERIAAAASVRYDPGNPEHLALAADGVADEWAEGEAIRLSDTFAAGSGPRRLPQLTTDRAEAEAIRLTSALYEREHPQRRDITRHSPAEQRARDRDQRRQALDDQLELAHALASAPADSAEVLRLSADMPSYQGAAPPSQDAPTDPRVTAYLRKFAGLNSTKAQRRHAGTGRFGGGVISQGNGTNQNGLASLDDADVCDLKDMLAQWAAAVGELRGYDANQSYAPPDVSDSVTGRVGYKPGA